MDQRAPKAITCLEYFVIMLKTARTISPKMRCLYDTCANVYVSYDKTIFKIYYEVTNVQKVKLGNEGRSRVVGMRIVELDFTYRKKVTLVNVLHVLDMNKNLVSGDLLGKLSIVSVYESGKLILTCNNVFVGNGYSAKGMIKLCTIDNIINKISIFAYMIESISLWNSRITHIGISIIKRLIKYGLILYDVNNFEKYEICVKPKVIKKLFHGVKRKTNLFDIVHSNLCDFNSMLTRGENRYFIAFIDDFSRFIHVCILKHKDDAFNAFKFYKTWVENKLSRSIKFLRSEEVMNTFLLNLMHIMKNIILYMNVLHLGYHNKMV